MSDSGGRPGDGASGDGGGVEYGELAVTLAAVLALVVAAALLPAGGLGSAAGGGPGEGGGTVTPAGNGNGGEGSRPTGGGLEGGSPSGVSLSNPPARTRIGSTEPSGGALAQTPQFVVDAPRNAYWRQAAYGTYTGSAWERSPQWQPMRDGVPHDARTGGSERLDYRVTLLRPSSSLPTAWQPSRVSVPNRSVGVEASTLGGVRATSSLPKGTTYRGWSVTPPRSPARLRAAGTDYPDALERRYTQVPAATPPRVGRFTSELTDGATTPYDAAITVRDWLREKPYSLNASHAAGEPVADQFIFEMDRGYCQYYATAMVVMLRTQGVPARYVVGYAPGEAVGDDRYLVTADRGHAWVEAYFPDVGWVRFDPTGSGRLPVQQPRPPYDVSLNRSAVAGAHVTVGVEKNGTPVVGAPVSVNGERVGWTDADGRVQTTLPYTADVTVTARPPGSATKYDDGEGNASAPRTVGGALPADAGRRDGAAASRLGQARPPTTPLGGAANGSSRTYRSDTNVTLSVRGRAVAGGGVTVVASIRDVPLRGATVTLDGDRVGRTGDDGRAAVSLAEVQPGTHRLGVRRDGVGGVTTLRVRAANETATGPDPIALSVEPPLGLALPGGPATVRTTRNGSPVASATVVVAGAEAGRTDANGTLAVTLPVAGSATVVASGPATTARTTVTGLFRNAALLGGAVLAGLGVLGWWLRRRGVTARGVARTTVAALTALRRRAVAASLRAAALLVRAGRALGQAGRRVARGPAWLVAAGREGVAALHPRSLARRARRWLAGLLGRNAGAAERTAESSSESTAAGTADARGAPPALRSIWREFVALVAPPRATTRTPGEIARHAVERGLPAAPVRVLTDAYRDATYGLVALDDDRLARVRAAIETLRAAARGERR
jgi:transglutaminase-like putative cysteine protease